VSQNDAASKITFDTFDKFQRKDFADRLTKVISTFYPFYNDAFVLSLNAEFGSGKTTFLEMWKHDLEQKNYKVISINAWETDFDEEPLIPIISALLDGVGDGHDNVKEALKGALGGAALIANDVFSHWTGVDLKKAMEGAEVEASRNNIKNLGDLLYKEFSFKKKAYKTIRQELSSYLESLEQKPLVIFVDELDRVRPDYAVKFLEAIKHIFSVQGVCFVLAVDRVQLEKSVKQLYGDIDFENYYRRFVTREANLPSVIKGDLLPFIESLMKNFFQEKSPLVIRFQFEKNHHYDITHTVSAICKAFDFRAREIETLFRIFFQFMAIERDSKVSWFCVQVTLILIAFFIKNKHLYHNIGRAEFVPSELFDYIKTSNFSDMSQSSWDKTIIWACLKACMRENQPDELNQIADFALEVDGRVSSALTLDEQRAEMIKSLSNARAEFGHLSEQSVFQQIYSRLENWQEFFE